MPNLQQIETDAALVAAQFKNEWGAFRRFISAHPLTSVILTGVAAFLAGHFL